MAPLTPRSLPGESRHRRGHIHRARGPWVRRAVRALAHERSRRPWHPAGRGRARLSEHRCASAVR